MSDVITRSGSSLARISRHWGSRGYMMPRCSGRVRASLARYTRPPASSTASSSRSSRPGSSGIADRDVHRERPAGARKGQHPRVLRAEPLEHREERRRARAAQLFEGVPHRRLGAERNHVLVLDAAAASVHPVPTVDQVERMEERRDGLHAGVVLARLAEPDLVERARRLQVDEPGRHEGRRDRERLRGEAAGVPALRARDLVERRVVAATQDPATHGTSAGGAVDPGDGVAVPVVAFAHARHEVVEVRAAFLVDGDQRRLDRDEVEGRVEDHAGEAHAAGGGPEDLGGLGGRDRQHVAAAGEQRERVHVAAERAVDVVALAVDVRGDRAADGDVPRARGDRDEPAAGSSQRISESRLVPAPTVTIPCSRSMDFTPVSAVASSTMPPPFSATSPYERPSPRAITPRGGAMSSSRLTSLSSSGVTTRARLGAVPPQPARSWSSPGGSVQRQAT